MIKTTERRTPSILFTAMTYLKIHACKFMLQRRCTILFTTSTNDTNPTKHRHSFLPGLEYLFSFSFSFFFFQSTGLKLDIAFVSCSKLVPDFRPTVAMWGGGVGEFSFFLSSLNGRSGILIFFSTTYLVSSALVRSVNEF